MPRRKSDFPTYRLHAQSGQAVVTLVDSATGRRSDVLLGAHDSPESRLRYDQEIRAWVTRGRRLLGVETDSSPEVSNSELMERFLQEHARRYESRGRKRSAEYGHLMQIAGIVRDAFGKEPARLMSPKRLKTIRSAMVARGWNRKQVNRQVVRLRRIYKWAVSEEIVPGEVLHALRAVEPLKPGEENVRDAPKVRPIEEEVVRASLACLSPPVAALVELLVLTGARTGELTILRTCDVDRSGPVWVFRPHYHKTERYGHERTILIGPEGQKVLSPWLKDADPQAYCFSPKRAEAIRQAARSANRKTPRWKSHMERNRKRRRGNARRRKPGERYFTSSIDRAIRQACDRVDARMRRDKDPKDKRKAKDVPTSERLFPHWSPHRIRHLAATKLRAAFGIELARVILGHSSADMTSLYAERDLQAAIEAIKKVG